MAYDHPTPLSTTYNRLADKVVLVTGASSGIGAAAARLFAAEGAKVVAAARRTDRLEALVTEVKAQGREAMAVECDVTDEASVAAAVASAVSTYGRLDGAFNNAGAGGGRAPIHKADAAIFDRIIAVNLRGVFLCLKHEIAQMLGQGGGGAIVNTASIAGLIGLATSGHYVAAKHGVVGLTKTAAIEYAKDGIRVNCVNPGYITTPMTEEIVKTRFDEVMAKVPMNRMGVPDEIAEAVVWMCSDKASFMTGASQVVDGGYFAA
jgi:NAD(P)-dependent dehydrogenase (short-subunit alcohol dehydrogenase family)